MHSRRNTAVAPDVTAGVAAHSSAGLLSPEEILDRVERERWRQEVATRVQQHRARRRRFDPNASLDLDFPVEPIAEEPLAESVSAPAEEAPAPLPSMDSQGQGSPATEFLDVRPSRLLRPPKVIRFPKSAEPGRTLRTRRDVDLPEPLLDAPRILDADEGPGSDTPQPEQMQLISAFADIRLEPASEIAAPAIELPPMPAEVAQRAWSAVIDSVLVLAAVLMFAATFVKLAEVVPATRMTWLYAFAVAVTLWLMFQYMFLVYGRGTPGMRASGLELCDFAGQKASLFARRCRVFATALSGLSLGLGFAWSFVDEDTLGWHDRISGTYLRSGDRVIG